MHFARDDFDSELLVRGYRPGALRVGERTYDAGVVLTTERVIEHWAPGGFGDLRADTLETLAALAPDVVLIGTGEHLRFPPPAATAGLLARGIGVEVMDTAAACRTFNILLSEGRKVVAALLV